jgi:uncharacterized Zn-binding protein involved in type VI secretion
MGQPGAKQGDQILATDIHIILIPAVVPIPTPIPHPFIGIINSNLSSNVRINGQPAAILGSTADNTPPHIPQGGPFQVPPGNKGQIVSGSSRVFINQQPAARNGDKAVTCDDVAPLAPKGTVVAAPGPKPVLIGD